MITHIRGVLASRQPNRLVVECGGIGYEVMAPLSVTEGLPDAGGDVFLLTEFIVREDSQTLYGFAKEQERALFRRLLKVSGIGAKTVIAMMSAMSVDELLGCISAEDAGRLTMIPGIGKKTAERLVVEMRGSDLLVKGAVLSATDSEASQTLAALGYNKSEIRKALTQLPRDVGDTTESLVRAALRLLSGK